MAQIEQIKPSPGGCAALQSDLPRPKLRQCPRWIAGLPGNEPAFSESCSRYARRRPPCLRHRAPRAPCPSYANVKSYSGTAGTYFAQTASGAYDPGPTSLEGNATVSINQSAMGLRMKSLTPIHSKPDPLSPNSRGFSGPTSGGAISVDDTLVDDANGGVAAGSQEATGLPTGNGPLGSVSIVQLGAVGYKGKPLRCKYQISVNYTVLTRIDTTPTPDGETLPIPPSSRMEFLTVGPPMQIPAGLHLSGKLVPVPVEPTGSNMAGYYQFREGAWEPALSTFLLENSEPFSPATFSWNLKPSFTKKHK